MKLCPHCREKNSIKKGYYFVKASRSFKRRYFCRSCRKSFSRQTTSPTKYQKKPFLNDPLFRLLVCGVSQRRAAYLLQCSKTTVEKKFLWLSLHKTPCLISSASHIQIDEMESIEITKLKPLTVPLAVSDRYEILGFAVGRLPAKGLLAEISRKKYGVRENQREKALRELLSQLRKDLKTPPLSITTDSHPLYPKLIKEYFPCSKHIRVQSRRKKERHRELIYLKHNKRLHDPMFALNQRCAKLRSDIKRLARRSWCVTKKPENLKKHLELYQIHNNRLVHEETLRNLSL